MPAHKLDDDHLITTKTLRQLAAEGLMEEADGAHIAYFQRSNGEFVRYVPPKEVYPHNPPCLSEQERFLTGLVSFLNRELSHDGAYIVCLTIPVFEAFGMVQAEYKRFTIMWMDKDGDIQFSQDWIQGEVEESLDLNELINNGFEPWGEMMMQCHATWRDVKAAAGVKEDQTIKLAQGQLPSAYRQ